MEGRNLVSYWHLWCSTDKCTSYLKVLYIHRTAKAYIYNEYTELSLYKYSYKYTCQRISMYIRMCAIVYIYIYILYMYTMHTCICIHKCVLYIYCIYIYNYTMCTRLYYSCVFDELVYFRSAIDLCCLSISSSSLCLSITQSIQQTRSSV